ncbi:hypothetical protein HPP92_007997 [Vanilla planifolia]|uniref:Uncharacterized protein n=1 Tax=Vanilla planifolia TaxID=51239 RepID=A0A835RH23_VANPL|nr:hypothetical protein HPP92_007997 [Vanilla planifolia]
MTGRWHLNFTLSVLLLLVVLPTDASAAPSGAVGEDDVRCVRELKQSIGDPDGRLDWNFSNTTAGFYCSGANAPDLSGNSLSGSIPSALCDWLPYLVKLDLSGNRFSGPIPPELSNCSFLNSLDLSSNDLSGQIPSSLSRLDRLKNLSLSHNHLSGEIPASLSSSFPSSVFEGNDGLCGHPVSSRCGSRSLTRTGLIIVIAAGVFGAIASLVLAYFIWRCYFSSDTKQKKTSHAASGEEGRLWATRLWASHNRMVSVSLFQKPIVKVKLADLLKATGDFHSDHIVVAGSSRVGTAYKAVLPLMAPLSR